MCRRLGNPQHFQILSFNVEGLKTKLDDPSFLELIQKYDIIILKETWKADTLKINLEDFWDYSQVRPKHKNAIRHSGGITVLAKNHIRFVLKLVENTEVFLRLEKSLFQFENDIFLCGAYIPPNNTTPTITAKTDYFRKLNEMLIKYKDKGDILIMGDLNARTGNEDGLQEKLRKQLNHLLPDIEEITLETGNRCSCDAKVNTSGRKSLTICSSHSLELANGQTPGDRFGNFTCFNNMRASVVDYLVLSRPLLKNIVNFKVLPPNFHSKHTPITATFKSSFVKFGKGKVLNHPKTYKWDNQGAVLFHSLLNQKDTQEKLGKLRFALESSSNTNAIKKTVKQFTDIISE